MYWIHDRGTMLQGSYTGEFLEEVAEEDPSYLRWLLKNEDELSATEREQIEEALNGGMV